MEREGFFPHCALPAFLSPTQDTQGHFSRHNAAKHLGVTLPIYPISWYRKDAYYLLMVRKSVFALRTEDPRFDPQTNHMENVLQGRAKSIPTET